MDLYIRRNENGRIVGVTFIDHETRTVVNGSRLGKAYSANAFELRFGGKRNPGKHEGLVPETSACRTGRATEAEYLTTEESITSQLSFIY